MAFQHVLPRELSGRLATLRRRIRFLALARGAGAAVTGICVLLLGLLLLDFFFDFAAGTRIGLLSTFGVGTLSLLGWFVVRPALRTITDAEVASLAEQQFPKFGERITSLVELSDPDIAESQKGSQLMREMLEQETVGQLSEFDIEEAISTRPAMRRVGIGAISGCMLFFLFVLFPTASTGLLARLFQPLATFASVGPLAFEMENGNRVVARGTDVPIAAKISWRSGSEDPIPEPATLHWTAADGEADFRDLSFNADTLTFDATIPNAYANFDFHVEADGSRSERFRIEVVDAPKVETARLQISPPGYVGLPASDLDGVTGPITVFEHSRIKFEVTFNKPIEGATIEWTAPMVISEHERHPAKQTDKPAGEDEDDKAERHVGPYVNELVALSDPIETELKLSSDGKSGTVELPATIQSTFAFRLKDRHDLRNDDDPHRQILITRDQPPTLVVAGSAHDEARPDDVYSVKVSASDDLGVGALELHVTSKKGLDRVLRAPADKLGLTTAEHQFRADLKDWGVADGDVLELQVRVADERPLPEPNVVWSEVRTVAIRKNASAQGTNDVLARQNELREELRAIRREVAASRDKGDLLTRRAQSDLDNEKEFHEAEELPKLADRESTLTERLKKLGEKFEEHTLFTNLVERLKTDAEQPLGQAAADLSAASDRDLSQQLAALKKNAGEADVVEERLIALEERFEELAALEKDLIELGRLANRATELADDAVRLQEFQKEIDAGEVPGAETPEQIAETKQALADQQAELMQEQDELMAALQSLLEKRPELIDAAREHELGRLDELTAEAKELADPQATLAEALQEDAEATAVDAAEVAAAQEVVAEQFEELAEAANAKLADPRHVATPIDPELAQQIVDELKKGNLEKAEQLQEKANDDLARVIENAKTDPLPKDAGEAAAELAKRQDDLAQRLEKAAAQKSDEVDPDKRERELRNLAAEQAALQRAAAKLDVPRDARDEQQAALNDANEALRDLLQAARQNEDAAQAAADAKQLTENPAGDEEVAQENAAALNQEAAALSQAAQASLNDAAQRSAAAAEGLRKLAQATPTDEERQADALRQLGEIQEIQEDELTKKLLPDGKPGEPPAQQNSKALAGEERFVAEELAQLDALGAEAEQQDAVEAAAAAINDLAANRQADIPASQRQLQQAMAALENRLKGEATPQEQVDQLRQDQSALQKEAQAALKAGDEDKLKQLAKQEEELAERAAAVAVPAAGNQQNAAQQAIQQAAEALAESQNGDQNSQQAAQSLQEAGEALKQLAQAMEPASRGEAAASDVEQLSAQQREAAEQNAELAEGDELETLPPNRDGANELAAAGDQLERLRVGDAALEEKLEAIEELRKAREQQDELNRQLGAPDPANPNQPAPQRPDAEQIQQALNELAQTQEDAADALQRLEQKLQPEPTEPGEPADGDADLARQIAEEFGQQPRDAAEVADAARGLAEQQAEIQEATETLDNEFMPNAPEGSPQRQQQEQLEEQQANLLDEVNDLPADVGGLPRAEAQEQMEAAAEALAQGNLEQAAQAQQEAGEALGQLAREAQAQAAAERAAQQAGSELAQNNPQPGEGEAPAEPGQPGAEPGQPGAEPGEPGQPQSGQPQSGQPQSGQPQSGQPQSGQPQSGQPQSGQPQPGEQAAASELAEQAQQLADAQSQVQERLAELRAEQNSAQGTQPGAEAGSLEGTPPDGAPPGSEPGSPPQSGQPESQPQGSEPGAQPQPEARPGQPQSGQPEGGQSSAQELIEQQESLTAEAAQLAVEAAQQAGADSPAAQAAAQAASNTSQAGEQAQAGQFDQAAQQASQAASDSQQAAQALQENAPQLAERAEQLAQQQEELSNGFEQIADSTEQRQQQLQAEAERLAQDLEEIARLLDSDVLGLNEQAQQARQAGQAVADSEQAMRQSSQSLQEGNQGEAAASAQEAADALQQAGQPQSGESQSGSESGQPQSGQPGSEPGQPGSEGSPPSGSPQSGSPSGQPQSESPQSGSPQSGQPGQSGEPGAGEPSPIPGDLASQIVQAAQQLQEAQQALAEAQIAAQSGQPGQPSGQPAPGQSGQPGEGQPGSEGQPGQSGSQPGEGQPGSEPGQPGEGQPGGSQPGEGQPGSQPGESQPGEGQPGQGSPGEGQPGSGQPGEGQPGQGGQGQSSLAQTAESLRQAAEMLNKAAQQLNPDQQSGASQPGQPGGPPSGQTAGMGNGQGGSQPPDLSGLDENLKRQALQNWGKLPGKLQTEILQSAGRKKNGDYAKLIKLYFEELAKSSADRK